MVRNLTKEVVTDAARKFSTRGAFARGDDSAYKRAIRNGWIDEVCAHMLRRQVTWTKDAVAEVAQKFGTRIAFEKGARAAHGAAVRHRWLDDVCAHMSSGYVGRDKDLIAARAKKFSTRNDFKFGDPFAYGAAQRGVWLREVCAHMERGTNGFNPEKPGYLYQIKFKLPSGIFVWKVGVTNRKVSIRLGAMGVSPRVSYEVTHQIRYGVGRYAYDAEQRLHRIGSFQGMEYNGERFLANGNTELFYVPLL
jgi:hypothetical protein